MSILKVRDKDGNFVDIPVISGRPASIKVGEVKLLEPNSEPTIENVGTEYDAIFDFGIPKGEYIVQGENFKLDLSDYAKQKQLDKEIQNRQQKDNSLQSQIKSLASGSPKGVYSDVTALKTANPDTGVYITSDNGHIYSWTKDSESEPVDLGIYQAMGILDNSIDKNKLKFYKTTEYNLFNKYTAIENKYIQNDTGKMSTPSDEGVWYASDYIEINPDKKLVIANHTNNANQMAFYDENKNYISGGFFQINNPLRIPTNAKYLRTTIKNSIDNFSINYGCYPYDFEHLTLNEKDINYINKDNVKKIKNPNNPIIMSEVIEGYYVTSSGNTSPITDDRYYGISNFINLAYGETLSANDNMGFISQFDENYNFLKTEYVSPSQYTPTEENCKYVRVLLLTRNIDTIIFAYGTETPTKRLPDYIPVLEENSITEDMIDEDIINLIHKAVNSPLKDKKITFLGDSITHGYDGANPGKRVSKPYPLIIQEKTGCIQTNKGWNGSTISGTGEQVDGKYKNGYQPMNKRITEVDSNQDYLIIFGGTNDFGSGESIKTLGTIDDTTNQSFYGSLRIICDYCYNNFIVKGMKIGFVTPIQRYSAGNGINSKGFKLIDYANAIKEVCAMYSIPVLDLYSEGGVYPHNNTFKTNFLPDGLHPNQSLYYKLADKIEKFIETL